MLEVHCGELGLVCRGTLRGRTKEELVQKVADHAARRHGVPELNQTLVNYVLKKTRETAEGGEASG